MKILKFGGTSVGTPPRMQSVARLITQESEAKIVVLSALSGTTNALVSISESLHERAKHIAHEKINALHAHYEQFIIELYGTEASLTQGKRIIEEHFALIRKTADTSYFTNKEERILLAQGELLSTNMFQVYLQEIGLVSVLLPALDFMRIDRDNEPEMDFIREHLQAQVAQFPKCDIFVTQGYICRNAIGEIDNLKRGGSDYTASLLGAAMRASEVQIWTDIDGMHNNDPRVVNKTFPVRELSFAEAAELAYFGAKILHPSSIRPAQQFNIPVRLLNTMQPEAQGTLITDHASERQGQIFKAIAAKDGITAINIQSSRMLLAYGFLRKIFEVFEKFKTPIDVITTSEVAVSLTIDDTQHLKELVQVLKFFGTVEVDTDLSIICIVGDFTQASTSMPALVLKAVEHIPIRMISFGGSPHNISLIIKTEYKKQTLQALNEHLFEWGQATA